MGLYEVTTEGGTYEIETADQDTAGPEAANPSLGIGGDLASGFLRNLSGLGDVASTVAKYNPFGGGLYETLTNKLTGTPETATPSAGDYMRQVSDWGSGLENSTQYGKDTLAGKIGEYLPGTLMGAPSLMGNGIKGAITAASKIAGSDFLTALLGFGGKQVGGVPGEIAGALLGGTIPGLVSRGFASTGSALEDAAQGARERALGVQFGDKSRSLGRNAVYLDDAGEVVQRDALDLATQVESPIQKQIQVLQDRGILDNAPNSASGLKIHLEKQKNVIGEDIRSLTGQAEAKTSGINIQPEFKTAQNYVDSFRDTTKARLQSQLDNIIDDYKAENGAGFNKLTRFTDKLQKETRFDTSTPVETTQLKRFATYDLRKKAEGVFDSVLPEKAGQFHSVNETYSALSNLGNTIGKRIAKPIPGMFDYLKGGSLPMAVLGGVSYKALGTSGLQMAAAPILARALAKGAIAKYPITSAKFMDALAAKASPVASALQSMPGVGQAMAAVLPKVADQLPVVPVDAPKPSSKTPQSPIPQKKGQSESKLSQSQNGSSPKPTPKSASTQANFIDKAINRAEAKMDSIPPSHLEQRMDAKTKKIEALIDADPVDAAIYETESGRNAKAKNPDSTASGAFQLIKSTAKALNVSDVFDIEANYKGYKALRAENEARFGSDPYLLYSAHFLGATVLAKVLEGKPLTKHQQSKVDELKESALPRFLRIYEAQLKKKSSEGIEV